MKYKKIYIIIIIILLSFFLYKGFSTYFVFNISNLNSDVGNNIIEKNRQSFIEFNTAKKRLELFSEWIKDDPLLYFTTLNTDEYLESISRLEQEEEKMLKLADWEEQIFPTSFLFSVASSTEAYNNFKDNINRDNALILLEQINKTVESYKSDVDNLKKTLDIIVDEATSVSIGEKTFTNREVVNRDFEKMQKNYLQIKKEIETREKCLEKSVKYCNNNLELKEIFESENNNTWGETLENDKNFFNYGGREGPYQINSLCFGDETNLMFIYKECPDELDYCMQTSSLATDFYLHKLSDIDEYSRMLISKGVIYNPTPGTQPYLCANLEYKPELALINYFYTNYKNKNIFAEIDYDFEELFEQGKILEEKFFNAEYPSEDDFNNLAKYYEYAYFYLSASSIDNDLTANIQDRYLLMYEKVHNFELISNMVVFYFSSMIKNYSLIEQKSISKYYVYTNRNNYSLFLLGFSNPVWRIDQGLDFHISDPTREIPPSIYSKYSDLSEKEKVDFNKQVEIYRENPKYLFY